MRAETTVRLCLNIIYDSDYLLSKTLTLNYENNYINNNNKISLNGIQRICRSIVACFTVNTKYMFWL